MAAPDIDYYISLNSPWTHLGAPHASRRSHNTAAQGCGCSRWSSAR
jgi:hypothetical protein